MTKIQMTETRKLNITTWKKERTYNFTKRCRDYVKKLSRTISKLTDPLKKRERKRKIGAIVRK